MSGVGVCRTWGRICGRAGDPSWLGPVLLNCVYTAFAVHFHAKHGEWIYPPLAKLFWRLLFPVATVPVWLGVRAMTKTRDKVCQKRPP